MGRLDCGDGYSIVWLSGLPAAFSQAPTVRVCLCVVGLGVDRIVDALRLLLAHPPFLTLRTVLRRLVACVVGVLLFVLAY